MPGAFHDLAAEKLSLTALRELQARRLSELLSSVTASNKFYKAKLKAAGIKPADAAKAKLEDLPFTTKSDLIEDQGRHPPFGTNLTQPLAEYTRYHQTSGSTGHPMRWLDTTESWESMLRSWSCIYHAAGMKSSDRICFAFSFGPFLGFWSAFEAATRYGALCFPAGGMTTVARLRFILDNGITAVCCTPTYALRMAETAAAEKINIRLSPVKRLIVAGEPGGSVPETRARIEEAWGARCIDHYGMTEVGPAAFECEKCDRKKGRLHVIETGYIAECIKPGKTDPVEPGQTGELVLTSLGRSASPLIRYRTGDIVRVGRSPHCECGRSFISLEGGILGRADDMIVVRGVNVYPSAIEAIVRRVPGIVEYRVEVSQQREMTELKMQVEVSPEEPSPKAAVKQLSSEIEHVLGLRIPVELAAQGSLPRFEMKAKRWVRQN
ncbi:MAG TPA: AMP-binding protein [Planctomycetota bacterium]|nr:AMP-binding protein [Planctomycetota bacterium]